MCVLEGLAGLLNNSPSLLLAQFVYFETAKVAVSTGFLRPGRSHSSLFTYINEIVAKRSGGMLLCVRAFMAMT